MKNAVLIKYLLDELTHAEQDHSDALCPTPNGFGQSRAGEVTLLAPVTTEEFRSQFGEVTHTLATVTGAVTAIHDELVACKRQMAGQLEKGGAMPAPVAPVAHLQVASIEPEWNTATIRQAFPSTPMAPMHPPLALVASLPTHLDPTGLDHSLPDLVLPPVAPKVPEVRGQQGYSVQTSWKIPIKDWFEADPSIGHLVPLKDWKPEWYEGALAQVGGQGMKYHQRRVVAQEFEWCVTFLPKGVCTHISKTFKSP